MGAFSSIEWCTHTFNPWIGCTKISAGCKFCYAEVDTPVRVLRGRGLEVWGGHSPRHRTSEQNWAKPRAWNRAARQERLRAEALGCDPPPRPRVFCSSLADLFESHPMLPAWRGDLWKLIDECTELDWLLLTKRADNVAGMVPPEWMQIGGWPPHVWLGTSVEHQGAVARVLWLLSVPAVLHFLSIEPLLGPLNLYPWLSRIDWVIIGGESGSHARPCDVAWIGDLLQQAAATQTPAFVKQLGSVSVDVGRLVTTGRAGYQHPKGGDPAEWSADLRVRQIPRSRVAA